MNLVPWYLAKSDASHQGLPAPTQLCDGYTTPRLVLHLMERLEHLPIHIVSSFVSILLNIPNLQEFHILHQRIQQEAPRVCEEMHFILPGIQSIASHKVVPQSPQKYEVTILPDSTGLLDCLGFPDSNFRELLSTKRLVLNMLPVTFRQTMQWHIAFRHEEHGPMDAYCSSNQL